MGVRAISRQSPVQSDRSIVDVNSALVLRKRFRLSCTSVVVVLALVRCDPSPGFARQSDVRDLG
jgi:hypothetical protein